MRQVALFTVLGDPTGKGRPKFTTIGGHPRAITPQKTVNYENTVRMEYESQCNGIFFDRFEALRVEIEVYKAPNKSTSKSKRAEMLYGSIRPGKKPDIDNIVKSILDALNGVAFEDDKQIVEISVKKLYAEMSSVKVRIERIGRNE